MRLIIFSKTKLMI